MGLLAHTFCNTSFSSRPLCKAVRQKCLPVLENFGYIWPQVLNCSKFPEEQEHDNICMGGEPRGGQAFGYQPSSEGKLGGKSLTPNLLNTLQTNQLFKAEVEEKLLSSNKDMEDNNLLDTYRGYIELLEKGQLNHKETGKDVECPSREMRWVPRLGDRCIPECGADVLYEVAEKRWADVLMVIFAAVSFLAALFAVVTFLLVDWGDSSPNYLYPERSLVFIAFSSLGHAVGHLLRLAMGREAVSCQDGLLSVEGHRDAHCFVVFLFVSFFSSAVSAWWTVS